MPPRPTYRRNETLTTILPDYPGNKLIGREYCNGEALYEPNFGTAFRWKFLTENPQKAEKKADTWVPEVVDCAAAFASSEDVLVWLGHASFLLRVGGVTFLTDPVLFSSLGLRRRHPLPCRPEDIVGVDYLLLSHGHRDHLDEASIKLLAQQNPNMQVLSSLGMAAVLRGMVPTLVVQEAGWWQQYALATTAGPEVFYLPASHWYRRGLFDENRVLWGSFLLRMPDGRTIYFAADTSFGSHFEQIERQFGPLDIVLMPIGAYKPAFMMELSHVNPHEAAKATNVLRAGHVVPMHYATFDLSDEPASEPLRLLREIADSGMLRATLHAPAVGEVMPWPTWE